MSSVIFSRYWAANLIDRRGSDSEKDRLLRRGGRGRGATRSEAPAVEERLAPTRSGAMVQRVDATTSRSPSSILVAFAAIMVAATPLVGPARANGPSLEEARRLLAPPKGSTSLGRTNGGELLNPVALPRQGEGFALLSMVLPRKTNYGTRELIEVIERSTGSVASRFAGSVLGIGNLGYADGRKIPWSVSHQSGRDADLGMYAVMADGTPYEKVARRPLAFVDFDRRLEARVQGAVVRFDLARNLALVQALAEDENARVQYIFVASWLKAALLGEAQKRGVSASTIARLAELMHQPTDSNPHADHYHVRLFCSVEDRLYGCINRGPPRAWVDPGDAEHRSMAGRVAGILRLQGKRSEPLVIGALDRLAAMMASSEVDAIVAALGDSRSRVRERALETLEAIADPRAAEGIVAILPSITDPRWAERLFGAIPVLDSSGLVALVERVVADPAALLHPKVRARAEPSILRSALRVLRDFGTAENVGSIIGLAKHRDGGVKKAAEEALRHITCQPLKGARAFEDYWAKARGADDVERAVSGLVARGLMKARGGRSRAGVGELIGLLDRREPEVRACAQRVLTAWTGHESDPRLRSPARNKKHWANWWRENESMSALR